MDITNVKFIAPSTSYMVCIDGYVSFKEHSRKYYDIKLELVNKNGLDIYELTGMYVNGNLAISFSFEVNDLIELFAKSDRSKKDDSNEELLRLLILFLNNSYHERYEKNVTIYINDLTEYQRKNVNLMRELIECGNSGITGELVWFSDKIIQTNNGELINPVKLTVNYIGESYVEYSTTLTEITKHPSDAKLLAQYEDMCDIEDVYKLFRCDVRSYKTEEYINSAIGRKYDSIKAETLKFLNNM